MDPLERTPPAVDLIDPTLSAVRRAAIDVATRAGVEKSAALGFIGSGMLAIPVNLGHAHLRVRFRSPS